MAQNNVIHFLTDMFSNKKPSKQDVAISSNVVESVVNLSLYTQKTGVARYLDALPLVTSVTKYLKKQPDVPATGIARYIAKQSLSEKNIPTLTGVAKYVSKTTKENAASASGVAKYLATQMLLGEKKPVITSVVKYINKQTFAAGNIMSLSGVAKYQAEQDLIDKKEAAAVMIARYVAEEKKTTQAKAEAEKAKSDEEAIAPAIEEPAATRLGRYLQAKTKLAQNSPVASGVTKYLAKQLIAESQKPIPTGVAKYLSKQPRPFKTKPVVSSVARYLEVHASAVANKPAISSVAKYMTRRDILDKNTPQVSSVSKYVATQSLVEKNLAEIVQQEQSDHSIFDVITNSGVAKYLERQAQLALEALAAAEESLVGEYIPANEAEGVARDSKDINERMVMAKEVMTGVSRYIEEQIQVAAKSKLTGVGKYLLEKA
ncbi:MAG: hypothetical protein HOP02_16185 [Methylococcaceae bacterium]|nr:hypothetical protein [Methylococcaceae bacterium]